MALRQLVEAAFFFALFYRGICFPGGTVKKYGSWSMLNFINKKSAEAHLHGFCKYH